MQLLPVSPQGRLRERPGPPEPCCPARARSCWPTSCVRAIRSVQLEIVRADSGLTTSSSGRSEPTFGATIERAVRAVAQILPSLVTPLRAQRVMAVICPDFLNSTSRELRHAAPQRPR
jgi:hypothetical protein